MRTLFKDTEYKIDIGIVDELGNFATGLTVTYDVRKATDNSLVTSGTTTEISGIYSYTYTFTENLEYRSKFTTPIGYENGFENILVVDEFASNELLNIVNSGITGLTTDIISISSGITDIQTDISEHRSETENRIKYILGLEQQNFRIIDQVYNSDNLLLTSTIRIYNNASDCNNDVNTLKEYSMEATYDGDGKILSYKVIES